MAEDVLYGNSTEPEFPFEAVANNLQWLALYLSTREKALSNFDENRDSFPALLDTVLVWCRARTAGFHTYCSYHDCKSLAILLNATLEKAGGLARYHRLELVQCSNGQFFVTCRNSPRFNWKTRLTHLEIGRNLDYSAPGHIGSPISTPRVFVQIVERDSFDVISKELTYFESLQDRAAKESWFKFNHTKEQLYNETMEKLGLRYRFKCVFEFPQTHDEVSSVMMQTNPPTAEWWDENCPHLSTVGEMKSRPSMWLFCNYRTRYDEYWELLRYVYSFCLKYSTNLSDHEMSTRCGFDWSSRLYRGLDDIYQKTEERMNPAEYDSLFNRTRQELESLAAAAEDYLEWKKSHGSNPETINYGYRRRLGIMPRLRSFGRDLYMHVFQRWKIREPLIYDGLPIPNVDGCCAYEIFQ